jgi:hypothetical protein
MSRHKGRIFSSFFLEDLVKALGWDLAIGVTDLLDNGLQLRIGQAIVGTNIVQNAMQAVQGHARRLQACRCWCGTTSGRGTNNVLLETRWDALRVAANQQANNNSVQIEATCQHWHSSCQDPVLASCQQ